MSVVVVLQEAGGKFYRDGNMIPIVQMGLKANEEMKKLGAPMVFDFITEERVQPGLTVDGVKRLFELLFAAKDMGRPFAMAPGVPAERVAAIRTAFNKMAADKDFLELAKRQKRDVDLVTGERIQKIVARMSAAPKSLLAKLEDLQKYKGIKQKAVVKYFKHSGKVVKIKRGWRQISIDYKGKKVKARVSGSKTKVTIDGKAAKRKAVKVGMTCTFDYPGSGTRARAVDCKS